MPQYIVNRGILYLYILQEIYEEDRRDQRRRAPIERY